MDDYKVAFSKKEKDERWKEVERIAYCAYRYFRPHWQQSQDESYWICVKDKLPEFNKKVLVWGESRGNNPQMGGAYPFVSYRHDIGESPSLNIKRTVDDNGFYMVWYVTHWMELPKSPNPPQSLKSSQPINR